MCGRYTQKQAIRKYLQGIEPEWAKELTEDRPFTYNLAPSALSWTIRTLDADPAPSLLKWGFNFDPEKKGKYAPPINARVETAPEKFPFKFSWKDKRCLVPADGWFEWKAEADGKQPYYFSRKDGEPIYFAGLWTGGTYALFTTAADGHLTAIHDRKPLSLVGQDRLSWLREGKATADGLIEVAVKADSFNVHPVSRAVSNWRNNGADLINPL